jgi:hypothetical protein
MSSPAEPTYLDARTWRNPDLCSWAAIYRSNALPRDPRTA